VKYILISCIKLVFLFISWYTIVQKRTKVVQKYIFIQLFI